MPIWSTMWNFLHNFGVLCELILFAKQLRKCFIYFFSARHNTFYFCNTVRVYYYFELLAFTVRSAVVVVVVDLWSTVDHVEGLRSGEAINGFRKTLWRRFVCKAENCIKIDEIHSVVVTRCTSSATICCSTQNISNCFHTMDYHRIWISVRDINKNKHHTKRLTRWNKTIRISVMLFLII